MKKGKKSIFAVFAIIFALLFSTQVFAEQKTITLSINNPIMTVDGTQTAIENGTSPIVLHNRTILPVRMIIETMGGTVLWDDATKTATLQYKQNEISMTVDSTTAYVNGEAKTLDVAPTIIKEQIMLPIRFIAENFGFTVDWEKQTQTVSIIGATAITMIGSDNTQTTTLKNVPMLKLSNGISIPQLGIGTFSLDAEQAYTSVLSALQNGYRHIDTAHAYGNERSVGRAMKDSGVPREEIWLTSKVWTSEYGEQTTIEAIDKMLDRLGVEYIDLVYLHQPIGDVKGAWKALEQCVKDGKIRALGLSNFDANEALFDDMIASAEIKPVIMQLECHPQAQRKMWQEKLKQNNMVFESWFPLGGRTEGGASLREHPEIIKIAQAHHKSAVQIIIRWHIQEGFAVVPGSSNPEHIAENIDVFDFELTEEEMEIIRNLNKEQRFFNMTWEELEQFITNTPIED